MYRFTSDNNSFRLLICILEQAENARWKKEVNWCQSVDILISFSCVIYHLSKSKFILLHLDKFIYIYICVCVCVCVCLFVCFYQPLHANRMWHKVSTLSKSLQVWIQFSFTETGRYTKVTEPNLPYYLPIDGGRIVEFILFPTVLILYEM